VAPRLAVSRRAELMQLPERSREVQRVLVAGAARDLRDAVVLVSSNCVARWMHKRSRWLFGERPVSARKRRAYWDLERSAMAARVSTLSGLAECWAHVLERCADSAQGSTREA